MDCNKETRPARGHASKLTDYFQILNSGDKPSWERAFDDTWHPEAIVDGRRVAALRDRHRRRLGAGQTERIHVLRDIDAYGVEFATECDGKRAGPFVATFRDGRIYRVL